MSAKAENSNELKRSRTLAAGFIFSNLMKCDTHVAAVFSSKRNRHKLASIKTVSLPLWCNNKAA